MTATDEVRSFNRFYTREIGLLNRHLPDSPFSLTEARVLYELAYGGEQTAADLGRTLRMDKAHVSKILARFRMRGLVSSRPSPDHGRKQLLALSEDGRARFAATEQGTRAQIDGIVLPLGAEGSQKLVSALREARAALEGRERPGARLCLRALRPGDLGWIIHRQAVLYHREYGWDWTFEGLVSDILGRFVKTFDPRREDAWVAEHEGAVVGSVFLVKGDEPGTAVLRLLYVERSAQGLGIGRTLVDRCVARARELGYKRVTLWTNSVLAAARHIYQTAGFQLIDETPHRSFGRDLVGQTWALHL